MKINYTDHKVFCDILLTGLHLVNVNRFEQERMIYDDCLGKIVGNSTKYVLQGGP